MPHQYPYQEEQHPRPDRPPYHPHTAGHRRMCRRKEAMCLAAGRAVAAGFGSVSTSTPVSAAEAAVAVAPSAAPPVISGGKGAARFVAAGVAVSVDSPARRGRGCHREMGGQ